MTATTNAPQSRERTAVIIGIAVLAIAILVGPIVVLFAGGRSGANFGDHEDIGTNHLGAATLDLTAEESSAALTAQLMTPGDTAVGWLDLENSGELEVRYSVVAESESGELVSALLWDVWRARPECDPTTPSTRLVNDLTLSAGQSDPLLGNPAPGLDDGDQLLGSGESRRMCISAHLPTGAPNNLQGLSANVDLHIFAEHHLEGEE